MDLFTIVGACVRRWYVTLPLVLVTAVLAAGAYQAVPPVYTSSVSIVVLPANTPEVEESAAPIPDNPYSGSGGPRFAASVLARNINTDGYRERIGLDVSDDVAFEASASNDQPMIRIDATAPTPELVLETLTAVTGQAGVVLAEFQTTAGAPEVKQYRIAAAVPADRVEDVTPSRLRSAGAIAVLGMGLAAALATALDALLRRRKQGTTPSAPPTIGDPDRWFHPDNEELGRRRDPEDRPAEAELDPEHTSEDERASARPRRTSRSKAVPAPRR